MKQILISGNVQTGKSTALANYIRAALMRAERVLVILPTHDDVQWFKANRFFVTHRRGENFPVFVSAASGYARHDILGGNWDVIAVDRADIVSRRVINECRRKISYKKYGTLILSTSRETELTQWVKTSKWYAPWTWGKGYWA